MSVLEWWLRVKKIETFWIWVKLKPTKNSELLWVAVEPLGHVLELFFVQYFFQKVVAQRPLCVLDKQVSAVIPRVIEQSRGDKHSHAYARLINDAPIMLWLFWKKRAFFLTRPKSSGTSTKQQNLCGAQTCCYTRKYKEHKTSVSGLFMQVQQPLFVCLVVERCLMIRVPPQRCHACYLCFHTQHQRTVSLSLQLWFMLGARCSCRP